MLLHLGIGSHGDRSTKLFGSHKPCYDSQWLLTSHYFKRCPTSISASPLLQKLFKLESNFNRVLYFWMISLEFCKNFLKKFSDCKPLNLDIFYKSSLLRVFWKNTILIKNISTTVIIKTFAFLYWYSLT